MTYDELNAFMHNYLTNDKTDTAIMLSAPWGYGKSYYVQNKLAPFLKGKGYKCVVVSVYGLNSTQEISKQIYLSLRTIKILNNKGKSAELISAGKAIGKTLISAVAFKTGLDVSKIDEKVFQQIYESVDLTDKLVVLEDIERSGIDIVDILGYVNNLTEHDHVKILLVANEEELIRKEDSTEEQNIYSEATRKYFRFKEKTIGDTIRLGEPQADAISSILAEYEQLSTVFTSQQIASKFGIVNLRTIKYACQKANDLLVYVNTVRFNTTDHLQMFKESIFFGIIRQAILQSQNYEQASKWTGGKYYFGEDNNSAIKFSNPTYQLTLTFRFCFDYLVNHVIPSKELIRETYAAYVNFCLYEANQTAGDKDLSVLMSYYICTEEAVYKSVENIGKRLKNEKDIPFTEYGNLARILIRIKYSLDIPVEECKSSLINNLRGKANVVDSDAMFVFSTGENGSEEQKEYLELKDAMISSLNDNNSGNPFDFDYNPKNIRELKSKIRLRDNQEAFVSELDIEKLKAMIANSDAEELDDLRGLFFTAYRGGVYEGKSFYYPICSKDRTVMLELIDYISRNSFENFDKVQLLQLDMLKDNLTEMINYGVYDNSSKEIQDNLRYL